MDILIAEDDMLTCELLVAALEDMGHTVTATNNGLEAWDHYKKEPRQIVVSDWNMPEFDGLDFCRKVREHKVDSYTYFILLTAKSGNENYKEAMDAGVDDFLVKPMNRQTLAMRLRVAERILSFKSEIFELKSIIPICSYCKKIRQDSEYWENLESYLETHFKTDVSHGICPDCFEKIVEPQFNKPREPKS